MAAEDFYPLITQYSFLRGLPWWLVWAQIKQESDFDPEAESPCGALGLLQLMPSSFPGFTRDFLLDPEKNIALGTSMLAGLRRTFAKEDADNALKYALAAYNGGVGYIVAAQDLCTQRGLDPAQWDNVKAVLPAVEYKGKRPDANQIIGYVETIWKNYESHRGQAIPA